MNEIIGSCRLLVSQMGMLMLMGICRCTFIFIHQKDLCQYNLHPQAPYAPTENGDEVAIIIPGSSKEAIDYHDLIVQLKDGVLRHVSELHHHTYHSIILFYYLGVGVDSIREFHFQDKQEVLFMRMKRLNPIKMILMNTKQTV